MRSVFALPLLGCVATFAAAPSAAQTPQSAAAKECLRLNAVPADQIPWDQHERVYNQWAGICEQALKTDGGDISVKTAAARAYGASGQREKEIVLLREMGAQNDAQALLDIYYMHNSFDRGHPERPQIVKRAEAEQSLRKAAELGNADAILRLATLLERGDTVKRDNAEAIRWTERAINNPAKDWRPIDMQVRLGRLLAKSDNSTEKVRGIALLEKLAQAGPYNAKTALAEAIRAVDPVRARSLFEQSLKGDPGGAIPPLADMLIKGEGGPADPKRAVSSALQRARLRRARRQRRGRHALYRRQTGAAGSEKRHRPFQNMGGLGLRRALAADETPGRQSRADGRPSGTALCMTQRKPSNSASLVRPQH